MIRFVGLTVAFSNPKSMSEILSTVMELSELMVISKSALALIPSTLALRSVESRIMTYFKGICQLTQMHRVDLRDWTLPVQLDVDESNLDPPLEIVLRSGRCCWQFDGQRDAAAVGGLLQLGDSEGGDAIHEQVIQSPRCPRINFCNALFGIWSLHFVHFALHRSWAVVCFSLSCVVSHHAPGAHRTRTGHHATY